MRDNQRTILKFLTKIKGYKHFGYFCLMKWLQRLFDFYLDASVHVALSIFALTLATGFILDIPFRFHLVLFLFFGSISCYNFVKYGVEAEKYLKLTNLYHKNIQYFSIGCLIIAIYHGHFIKIETLVGSTVLVLITGLYALPLLPKAKNLRSWGGLKIIIVAVVWAGATVILPVLEEGNTLSWDVWIETVQRALLVLVLLIPFEIRDLQYDALALRTLPQRFGVSKTKVLGLFLTGVIFFLPFFKDDLTDLALVANSILTLMLVTSLVVTKQTQSKYFASFWIEAIPIFWVVLLILMQRWY